MSRTRSILWLLLALPVSCASHSDTSDSAAPSDRKPLSQRLEEKNGYKQDTKGNWVPQNDKRSSFENQGKSPYFQGNYQKKNYQAGTYSKKSWWGNKDYGRESYAGKTEGNRFKKSSPFNQQGAPESDTAAHISGAYQTSAYATGSARETGRSHLAKPSDPVTHKRRKVFKDPEILDWKEQRSLSLEQSKGILGH